MRTLRLASAALALFAIGATTFAADIVGKWKGTIVIEVDKATREQMKGKTPPMPSLALELRADKTYKGTQTGGSADKQSHVVEGTYTFDGTTLKLTPKKRDGAAATGDGAKVKAYVLSKDGKTLTLDLTSQMKIVRKGEAPKASPFVAKMVLHRAK